MYLVICGHDFEIYQMLCIDVQNFDSSLIVDLILM